MDQQPGLQLISVHLRPLCVPQLCDDTYKVRVQLDQPLWSADSARGSYSADILSCCVQLDAMIATQFSTIEFPDIKKTVTFEQGLTSKVITILEKMAEILSRKGILMSVEEYIHTSGLVRLFPRVSKYLSDPATTITAPPSEEMEGYFARVAALNNMLILAQQLQTNVQTSVSHKYIAHQLALLYQTLSALGEPLVKYKKSIESRFAEFKGACSAHELQTPRLPSDLQRWLTSITSDIIDMSLNKELTVPYLDPVTALVSKLDTS